MATYRRDDESPSDYSERVERCEHRAGWYFNDATKVQLARYNERMAVASAYKGSPRWERERDAAQKEFTDTTKEASELYELTFAEFMTDGEVSEELNFRWDQLDVAQIMQAAE